VQQCGAAADRGRRPKGRADLRAAKRSADDRREAEAPKRNKKKLHKRYLSAHTKASVMPYYLLFLCLLFWACGSEKLEPEAAPPPLYQSAADSLAAVRDWPMSPAPKDSFWVAAVGDIVPGTNHPMVLLPPHLGRDLIGEQLLPYLREADLSFGNFEAVLRDSGGRPKACYDPKSCFRFRLPPVYLKPFQRAGFDILNIASNHMDDFGRADRLNTERQLQDMGFMPAGLAHRPCVYFVRAGRSCAFCAFSPFYGSFNMKDRAAVRAQIRKAKANSELLIVSLHGGAEGPDYRHQPKEKPEIFLGFDRGNLYETAHLCIDEGADLIIGTGPHVSRGMELYKERLILYSLGNFCTYSFRMSRYGAHAPLLRVALGREGQFLAGQIIPIVQKHGGMPRLDPKGLAINDLRELSRSDFPESLLWIREDGWFFRE